MCRDRGQPYSMLVKKNLYLNAYPLFSFLALSNRDDFDMFRCGKNLITKQPQRIYCHKLFLLTS